MSERPMRVRNAADPEQVERADKKEKREAIRFSDDLQNVMNMPQGRRVLTTILRKCGVGVAERTSDAFNNSGSITSRNLGTMEIGFWLQFEMQESAIELYERMVREARDQLLEASNG